MTSKLENALEAEKKATKRLNVAKNMFFAYLAVVTMFTAVQSVIVSNQLRDNVEQNAKNGQKNHQLTREYVKCIAITLLKPVAQRTEVDFKNCTKEENKKSSVIDTPDTTASNNSITPGTGTAPMQAPQMIVRESKPDSTTGAAPPDPEPEDQPSSDNPNPANENSRVWTIIDQLLQEVDNSPAGGTLNKLGL